MRAWIVGEASILLIGGVLRLWGRSWINTDTARRWNTAIMRAKHHYVTVVGAVSIRLFIGGEALAYEV